MNSSSDTIQASTTSNTQQHVEEVATPASTILPTEAIATGRASQPKKIQQLQQYPQRVVSLLGAATEVIYRLGLSNRLVGRSHECDYPSSVLQLPCISRPRLDVNASSREIDDAVRAKSAVGETVYKLDDQRMAQLQPDLLITQDHCHVCAITPHDFASSLACQNIPQLVVKPSTLNDCFENVSDIANAMGVPERGQRLRESMQYKIDRVTEMVKWIKTAPSSSSPPRVALLEWIDPIMGCGYWLPELVREAGGQPLHCPPPGGATPTISFETLLNNNNDDDNNNDGESAANQNKLPPDIVIFALCGFGLTRAAAEIKNAWTQNQIDQLADRLPLGMESIFVVDGNYLINRSGPRVVESIEALAEAIHPELKGHFGHYGTDLLTNLSEALMMVEKGQHTGSTKIRPPPFPMDQNKKEEEKKEQGEEETTMKVADSSNISNNDARLKKPMMVIGGSSKEVVQRQLSCLQLGRFVDAFALNSKANQGRWCDYNRFVSVLRGHPEFCKLLGEGNAIIGQAEEETDEDGGSIGVATVRVALPESPTKLIWTMVTEEEQNSSANSQTTSLVWRTETVAVAKK